MVSTMPLHHLGPAGTFSEQAARSFGSDVVPRPTFDAIAAAVAGDGGAAGVLPYYNLLEGLVQEPIDLIYEHRLHVAGACRLPITFAAGSRDGTADHAVVRSHPKALAQCSSWLREHMPDARQEPTPSTADAANAGEGVALANAQALRDAGLEIVADDIGNRPHGRRNFTDFLLVRRDPPQCQQSIGRTLLAVTPNLDEPGLLARILGQFAFHNLSVAKIHSRPALDAAGTSGITGVEPQMFYLEVVAAPTDEPFRRAADALRFHFRQSQDAVRVLGGWEAEVPSEE